MSAEEFGLPVCVCSAHIHTLLPLIANVSSILVAVIGKKPTITTTTKTFKKYQQ